MVEIDSAKVMYALRNNERKEKFAIWGSLARHVMLHCSAIGSV